MVIPSGLFKVMLIFKVDRIAQHPHASVEQEIYGQISPTSFIHQIPAPKHKGDYVSDPRMG